MTQSQLSALCRRWKRRLPLISNWKVKVRFAREAQMSGELGRVEFWPEMLRAEVLILHPEDRSGSAEEKNPESDLIHELVHLLIDGHSVQQKYDVGKERAINCLADALYRAYRPRKRRAAKP